MILMKHLMALRSTCDPFDRMLVAQAQEKNLTIITKDGIIPQYDVSTLTFE